MAKISIRTTLRPGDILANRYRVESLLGSGKFAHVYLAHDEQTKTSVAVKILGKKAARDEDSRLFFKRECITLHDLRHPNVVRYIEQGYEGGTLFLVLEFFDGLPLTKWLAEKEVSVAAFNEVMRQVFEAIIYVHTEGRVHLDLTLNNVLVQEKVVDGRPTYEVRIIDFGVADTIGASHLRNAGTVVFSSPEQAAGHDPAATMDQFSLGVLLHIAYTGHSPGLDPQWPGYTKVSLESASRSHQLAPWVSPEMSEVLHRAVAYEPTKRYASVRAFFQAWQAATQANASQLHTQTLPRFNPQIWEAPPFFKSKQIGLLCCGLAALFFLVTIVALAYR